MEHVWRILSDIGHQEHFTIGSTRKVSHGMTNGYQHHCINSVPVLMSLFGVTSILAIYQGLFSAWAMLRPDDQNSGFKELDSFISLRKQCRDIDTHVCILITINAHRYTSLCLQEPSSTHCYPLRTVEYHRIGYGRYTTLSESRTMDHRVRSVGYFTFATIARGDGMNCWQRADECVATTGYLIMLTILSPFFYNKSPTSLSSTMDPLHVMNQ